MENEFYEMEKLPCEYLSGCGTVVLPETWRDGTACVSLTGAQNIERVYVDGSYLANLPFDVRIRKPRCADNVADKLDAAAFFAALADYIHETPMPAPAEDWKVLPSSGQPFGGSYAKSAVYDDGTEEYRAGYLLKYYIKRG